MHILFSNKWETYYSQCCVCKKIQSIFSYNHKIHNIQKRLKHQCKQIFLYILILCVYMSVVQKDLILLYQFRDLTDI